MGDLSDKWRLTGHYMLRWPLATSLSQGGLGHQVGLTFAVNDDLEDSTNFTLAYSNIDLTGAANDPEASNMDNSYWDVTFGWGSERRLTSKFTASGGHWFSLFSSSASYIGVGTTSMGRGSSTVGGMDFSSDTESAQTLVMNSQTGIGLEFIPTPHFGIQIAPRLIYGVSFEKEGSERNRLMVEFGIMANIGYFDKNTLDLTPDPNPSDMEIAFQTYAQIHGLVQSIFMNMTLADMQERLSAWIPVGEGDPLLWDVPVLQGASAFMGGFGQASATEYFLRIGKLNLLPLLIGVAGSAANIGVAASQDVTAGASGGTAGLLNALGWTAYYMFDVATAEDRQSHGAEAATRLLKADIVRFAFNDAALLIGALILVSDAESDAGSVLLSAGAQANFAAALVPAPAESGALVRATYSYIPITYYNINYDLNGLEQSDSGSRSGILIQKSWRVPWLFSEIAFTTPALRLDNLFRLAGAAPSDPYAESELPSEVRATLGFQGEWTYFRIGGGIDTLALFGAPGGAAGGIGVSAAADVLIPFNGRRNGAGIALGLRFGIAALFPSGWQYEFAPHIGATIPF